MSYVDYFNKFMELTNAKNNIIRVQDLVLKYASICAENGAKFMIDLSKKLEAKRHGNKTKFFFAIFPDDFPKDVLRFFDSGNNFYAIFPESTTLSSVEDKIYIKVPYYKKQFLVSKPAKMDDFILQEKTYFFDVTDYLLRNQPIKKSDNNSSSDSDNDCDDMDEKLQVNIESTNKKYDDTDEKIELDVINTESNNDKKNNNNDKSSNIDENNDTENNENNKSNNINENSIADDITNNNNEKKQNYNNNQKQNYNNNKKKRK